MAGRSGPVEQHHRRPQREDGRHLHENRADEEVGEVGAPARTEQMLLRKAREHPLERHEHRRVDDQVEQEPVEPQERARLQFAGDRHLRSAEQRRGHRRGDGDGAEHLVAAQREADDAEQEAADEDQVQQAPHQRQRVERAGLRRGEQPRKVEAQHRAQAEHAADRPEQAAHPPAAECPSARRSATTRRRAPRRPVPRAPGARASAYGAAQTKLAASSMLPVPR